VAPRGRPAEPGHRRARLGGVGGRDVRVACAQLAPWVGDAAGNLRLAGEAIAHAAERGADLVVLPELVTSGYAFRDAAEARALALPAGAPELAAWGAAGPLVVGGFCELGDDGRLYNSAAVVGPGGVLSVYRKAHLWDRELELFSAGDAPPAVVDTQHGRIGVLVCYDLAFPECVRAAALAGAELLCVPTNWPREPRPAGERPMEVMRAMVAASTNRMAVAACDRCGAERGVEWVAGSVIADERGWPLAGPPERAEPALLVADVDLARARDKALSPRNDALGDRRPDLYASPASDETRPPARVGTRPDPRGGQPI
jgi:predicted amidohydrolase